MDETKRNTEQGGKSIYAEQGDVYVTYAGERHIPHALTPPPFQPEIFLGREDELQQIHDRLFTGGGNLLLLVNGEGGVGKAIAGSPIATGDLATHMDVVIHGVPGTAMQAFGGQLNDVDMAAVLTYQRSAFGNNMGDKVQPIDVFNHKKG